MFVDITTDVLISLVSDVKMLFYAIKLSKLWIFIT
jgi:hypothetical protein